MVIATPCGWFENQLKCVASENEVINVCVCLRRKRDDVEQLKLALECSLDFKMFSRIVRNLTHPHSARTFLKKYAGKQRPSIMKQKRKI